LVDNHSEEAVMPEAGSSYDFSMETIPDSWVDASVESGQDDTAPLTRRRPRFPVPHAHRADSLAALLGGLAMAITVGAAWFALETRNALVSPWLVAAAGLLIGLGVRIAGGPYEPPLRAMIALVLFLVTSFVTSYLIVRHGLRGLHIDLGLPHEEQVFLRRRLLDPEHAVALAAGCWLAIRANYLRSQRGVLLGRAR
jgi:hypothetical protein